MGKNLSGGAEIGSRVRESGGGSDGEDMVAEWVCSGTLDGEPPG